MRLLPVWIGAFFVGAAIYMRRAVAWSLQIIGLAGIPDDLATWTKWLTNVPSIVWDAIGVVLIVIASIKLYIMLKPRWDHWFANESAQPEDEPPQRKAEQNAQITYITQYSGNHIQYMVTGPPEPTIKFPPGVHDSDDAPTFVRLRTKDSTLLDSRNISVITDTGTGDFTFQFAKPIRLDRLTVVPIVPTPPPKKMVGDGDGIRVIFDSEPEIVALKFSSEKDE